MRMEPDEIMKSQYFFLDQVDFKPYLDEYDDLDTIWTNAEHFNFNTELTDNQFLCGDLFNWLTKLEFKEYLENRYNIHFEEITKYILKKEK